GDLARTPGIVAAIPDAQNLGFHRRRRAIGAAPRSTRPIAKPFAPFRPVPCKPFVRIGAADPKTPAQLGHIGTRRQRQAHEVLALLHHRLLLPRHRGPLSSSRIGLGKCLRCLRTGVSDVSSPYSGGGTGRGVAASSALAGYESDS